MYAVFFEGEWNREHDCRSSIPNLIWFTSTLRAFFLEKLSNWFLQTCFTWKYSQNFWTLNQIHVRKLVNYFWVVEAVFAVLFGHHVTLSLDNFTHFLQHSVSNETLHVTPLNTTMLHNCSFAGKKSTTVYFIFLIDWIWNMIMDDATIKGKTFLSDFFAGNRQLNEMSRTRVDQRCQWVVFAKTNLLLILLQRSCGR